jgi:DNA-binding XRE family transcriptional regulator
MDKVGKLSVAKAFGDYFLADASGGRQFLGQGVAYFVLQHSKAASFLFQTPPKDALNSLCLSRIRDIRIEMLRERNMDYDLLICRLSNQIREKRLSQGLTQAELAQIAGLTRQKVVAVEKGTLSVGMSAYARVLGALDCELAVIPAVMPTLDEIQDLFE